MQSKTRPVIRVICDGEPTQFQQAVSSNGLPKCILCLKTIPLHARRHNKAPLFCSGKHASAYGYFAGQQVWVAATWKEPVRKAAPDMSHATGVSVGDTIKRKGKTYEVLNKETKFVDVYAEPDVTLTLKDLRTGKEIIEKVSSKSLVQRLDQ